MLFIEKSRIHGESSKLKFSCFTSEAVVTCPQLLFPVWAGLSRCTRRIKNLFPRWLAWQSSTWWKGRRWKLSTVCNRFSKDVLYHSDLWNMRLSGGQLILVSAFGNKFQKIISLLFLSVAWNRIYFNLLLAFIFVVTPLKIAGCISLRVINWVYYYYFKIPLRLLWFWRIARSVPLM